MIEFYFVVAIVCAALGATVAQEDNRVIGALLGALLGPVGVIVAAVMK